MFKQAKIGAKTTGKIKQENSFLNQEKSYKQGKELE